MSQSLIHQVLYSHESRQASRTSRSGVAIPYSSGLIFSPETTVIFNVMGKALVAIPYSSGLIFSPERQLARGFGLTESQSLIHQVLYSHGGHTMAEREQMSIGRNPLFIRSYILTFTVSVSAGVILLIVAIPYSSGLIFSLCRRDDFDGWFWGLASQSLIHQVLYSHPKMDLVSTSSCPVAIPYSSGLIFSPHSVVVGPGCKR